jgi:hypothetical protein
MKTTYDQVHYLLLWLACFIFCSLCLHERTICENITWIVMTSSLLGVACFSWSILLIASIEHLKCSSDHHFHVSLPSTTLGLPTHWRQAPTLGRNDLSLKNHFDTHLKWLDWLIQVMDLIWWVTLNPSLSPFLSTCLSPFHFTKWFPMVTRT